MFLYEVKPADAITARFWESGSLMTGPEFFGRSAAQVFGNTTIGLAATEARIQKDESAAGEWRPGRFFDEDEWIGEPGGFDPPELSPVRQRIVNERRERRKAEERALAREADARGLPGTAIGLTAALVAGMADPINFIPFGAGAAAKTIGAAVKSGVAAGVAGNVAADALLIPWANSYQEELGWKDLAVDAILGAALGGLFGAAGGFFRHAALDGAAGSGHGPKSPLPSPDGLSALPDEKLPPPPDRLPVSPPGDFDATPDRFYGMDDNAGGFGTDRSAEGVKLAEDAEGVKLAEDLKNELTGQDRVNAGKLIDATLEDIGRENPLDAAGHAKRLGMEGPPFMPDGRPPVRTAKLIAAGRPHWGRLDVAEILPLAKEFHNRVLAKLPPIQARGGRIVTIRGKNGWGKIRGRVPNADKLKLLPFIDKIIEDAEWVFTEPSHHEGLAKQGVKMHDLLAAVEYEGRMLEVRLKVRETSDGRFFYDFFNESEAPRWEGREGTPPDMPLSSAHESASGGGYPRLALEGLGVARGERPPTHVDDTGMHENIAKGEKAVNENPGDFSARPDKAEFHRGDDADVTRRSPASGQEGGSAESDTVVGKTVAEDVFDVNLETRDITPDFRPEPASPPAEGASLPDALRDAALHAEAERISGPALGRIAPEIAELTGLRPGTITLAPSALRHIEEKHGEQIRGLGFADAREFVNYTLANVDAVYQGENRRIFEFVTRETKPQGRVLTRVEFELSGDRYEIRTAGAVRKEQYKKRTPLWDRSHAHPSAEADPIKVSHRGSPGPSGERLDLTGTGGEVKDFTALELERVDREEEALLRTLECMLS